MIRLVATAAVGAATPAADAAGVLRVGEGRGVVRGGEFGELGAGGVVGAHPEVVVVVGDVLEVVDLLGGEEHGDGEGVDGGVSPLVKLVMLLNRYEPRGLAYPLKIEAALAVQELVILLVRATPEEVQVRNLKIVPVVASVPPVAVAVP